MGGCPVNQDLIAGIDLGGTKILAAVADRQGNILSEIYLPTEAERGTSVILNNLCRSVSLAMSKAGFQGEPGALGIGVPGAVDKGIVHLAPNLGWKEFDLGRELPRIFNCKVETANDANLAALGEYVFGAGQGSSNMLYVTVSTGIGAGIVYRGELFTGESGTAGELVILPSFLKDPFAPAAIMAALKPWPLAPVSPVKLGNW
ncbi:hypothetical protein N752_00765 [Desulforamulus aquiferis]|nr:hypothetical protein N752_00765 [Desulforamulus aquiferis]